MAVETNILVPVVDEFETIRRVIKNLLKQLDFQNVDDAESGEQALTMLRAKDDELAIAGWDMDPMTGRALSHEGRANDRLRDPSFVRASAGNQEVKGGIAAAAGLSAFLAQPFSAEALKGKIAAELGS